MATATRADLRPTFSTVRRILTMAGVEAGIVGTVSAQGHKWIRAGVHRDDSRQAAEAVRGAFPGHVVQGFTSEVRVRVTP